MQTKRFNVGTRISREASNGLNVASLNGASTHSCTRMAVDCHALKLPYDYNVGILYITHITYIIHIVCVCAHIVYYRYGS